MKSMTLNGIVCSLVATFVVASPLRGEVVEGAPDRFVDYITTVGSSALPYIDTGVKGRSGTRLELFFTGWTKGSYSSMIGMRDVAGHFLIDNPYGNSLRFLYKDGSKVGWAAVSFSSGNYHHVTYQVADNGTCSVFVDGTEQNVSAMNGQGALDSQCNFYLFGYNSGGNPAVASSQTTLYLCRIWQTDGSGAWRLVRNFRPCVKTVDGAERAGLYDAVEGKVYFSFASGADFAAPPAEEEPFILEWVGSTGKQYVDTEAIGRSGSKVDLKFTGWAEGDYKSLFGLLDGMSHLLMDKPLSNSVRFLYKNADGRVAVDFGSEKYHELSYAVDDAGTGSVVLDGASPVNVISNQGEFRSVLPFYIFGYNRNGNLAGLGAAARLYGCTISQTDGEGAYVPVRDFQPAKKYGLVGLYDTVDGIFIPGVGGLEAGPMVGKPQKYVEYVESSGAQYIDTGITGRSGTAVQMQFKGWVGGTYTAMVGALGNNGKHMISMSPKGTGIATYYNTGTPFAEVAIPFGADTYHDVLTEWANGGVCRMFVDGVETDYGDPLGDLTTSQNLFLFAGNNNGTVAWNTAAKLYGCKIWQDGKLVRDFRPCVAPNGKAALYDEVESQIYYANGGDLAASGTEVAVIAAWKGGAVASADDIASAGNWTCYRPDGKTEIAGAVPGKATTVVISSVSDPLLSIPAGIVAQGWGGTRLDFDSIALQADADWTPLGSVVLKDGIAIDLAGHNLYAGDVALSGTASVENSGAAGAAFSIASSKPVSVSGLTFGDKVKVVKSGVGSMVNTIDRYISGATGMELEIDAGRFYSTAAQYFRVGLGLGDNVGKLTMNGGSFAVSSELVVGQTIDSVGVLEQTGGYIACAKEMTLGYWSGTGTLRQSGGTLTVNGSIYLGRKNGELGTAGVIEHTGGTIAAHAISRPSGASTIAFNGGTVRASIANASFFNNLTNVTIGANGLRLETAKDIGFANTTFKTSGGKITKAGAGRLDFSGLTVEVGDDAPSGFDLAVAVPADGEAEAGAFVNLPTLKTSGWGASLKDGGRRCLVYRKGTLVVVR